MILNASGRKRPDRPKTRRRSFRRCRGFIAFHRKERPIGEGRLVDDGRSSNAELPLFLTGTASTNDFERKSRLPNATCAFVERQRWGPFRGFFQNFFTWGQKKGKPPFFVSSCSQCIDNFRAMLVVKLLIDRRALQWLQQRRFANLQTPPPPPTCPKKFLDFKNFELVLEGFFEPNHYVLFQKINNAVKLSSRPGETGGGRDGAPRRWRMRATTWIKIGAHAIHTLFTKRCAGRDCRLGAKRFRLRLHAGDRVKNTQTRAVQHAQ